eukprot:jgi/Mesvir1/12161/Mv26332-RA.2
MTSPRAPYKAGEWCCFCPYSTTATCSGKVIAELPLGTLHVQLLAPLSGHNGCLAQLTTAVVFLPTQLCHRIRVVPWSLEQSCVYQPNPNLPDAAIIWLHVGSTRLDMLSLDPVEFGWVLNQGDSRTVKGLYEYTAEWGYTMLLHKNHQFHPGRTRWGATEWPGHTWVRNITLAADHPLIDRRATDVQHLLMHRSIGVGEILHRRFQHPATCLCTNPTETVEHRFLWCSLQGVWTWLIGLWAAWTSEPIIPVSTRSIIFGITGTPGLELTFSQQAWIWLRTCMLYTIWTVRNDVVFNRRTVFDKAGVLSRFIYLWNSGMRRYWMVANEQNKIWDPGADQDKPSPLEIFHDLMGKNRIFTHMPNDNPLEVQWLPWSSKAPF